MQASENAYELIKEFEQLRLRAYLCPAKVWTIGYGSTRGVTSGMVIDTKEALRRLKMDIEDSERDLKAIVKVPLAQHQFDALVSWIFNVGVTNAKDSTLIRKLNSGQDGVSAQLIRWNKATVEGKLVVLRGLTRRRITERRLFDSGLLRIEK